MTTFFGFKINEYNYKRISFTRHRTHRAAEKRHYVKFVNEQSPVSQDYTTMVFEGVDAFVKWAAECDYAIEWEKNVLIHKDALP